MKRISAFAREREIRSRCMGVLMMVTRGAKTGEEGEILREGESGLPARPPNEEGELHLGDRSSSRSITCRSSSIAGRRI